VPLTALAGLRLSRRAFGGIGGDVVGATGEAARSALLVVLSATM
jgi:adenosylcobinamide-GDP ribazoletransferase